MSPGVAAARGLTAGRARDILLWCVRAFLALVFLNTAWLKLTGSAEMVELFSAVGVGQWLRYATAFLEFTGAVLIVVPKTKRTGAVLLAIVMLGALSAHLFILHVSPVTPAVLLLLVALVLLGRGVRRLA